MADGITVEEAAQLGATAEAAPGIVGRGLTIEQAAQLGATSGPMGTGESAARLFYKHLTLGTEPGADRAKAAQAAKEHPILDLGTGAGAMLAQTAALGPFAAAAKGVQGAGVLAQAARGTGKALEYTMLPNLEAQTALTAGRTGAKLAGNYSAAEALGHGLTEPGKTWGDVAKDVGVNYATGTALGFPLGVGVHGVSRGIGAIANRALPELQDLRATARAPETQGAHEIVRNAGYDNATARLTQLGEELRIKPPGAMTQSEADNVASLVKQGMTPADIAAQTGHAEAIVEGIAKQIASREAKYGNLNLHEAMEMGDLKPMAGTGELKPEVLTYPNLGDLARDAANTSGRGQQIAANAFRTRKNEMSATMQGDIDTFFSAANREADAARLQAQKATLDKRYDRFRNKEEGVTFNERDFGPLAQRPGMREAFDYAAEAEMARAGNVGKHVWTGQEGQDFLTPGNILDMHHYLVMKANSSFAGDKALAMRAGNLKKAFQNWIDNNFSKRFEQLNQDFASFKRTMDATEYGTDMAAAGQKSRDAFKWFTEQQQKITTEVRELNQELVRHRGLHTETAQRWAAPTNAAQKGAVTRAANRVAALENTIASRSAGLEEFTKAYGEALKQFLAERGENGPGQLIARLTTQEGKRRLTWLLGKERGPDYIRSLYNKQTQTNLGQRLYGGPDTAYKTARLQKTQFAQDALSAMIPLPGYFHPFELMRALGRIGSGRYAQNRADQLNQFLSQQGTENLVKILDGIKAQEALRQTAHPVVRNPFLRAPGPLGSEFDKDRWFGRRPPRP